MSLHLGTREPAACLRITDLRHSGIVLCCTLASHRASLSSSGDPRPPGAWAGLPRVAPGLCAGRSRVGRPRAESGLSPVSVLLVLSPPLPLASFLHIVLTFGG